MLLRGVLRHDPKATRSGWLCVFVVLAGAVVAVAAMEWALHHPRLLDQVRGREQRRGRLPLLFTITGLWAALEGSILLWVLILAGYLDLGRGSSSGTGSTDPMVGWALIVGLQCGAVLLRVHGRRREPVHA